MIVLTGGALKHARYLAENLQVDAAAMRDNIARGHDLILAEAVVFALSRSLPRSKAEELVKEACGIVTAEKRPLIEVVESLAKDLIQAGAVDWHALAQPKNYLGEIDRFIEAVLQKTKAVF
jgi:3-carboxy-cis,cis-muconate cycloisomerase